MQWDEAAQLAQQFPQFVVQQVDKAWKLACKACRDTQVGKKRAGTGVVSSAKAAKRHLKNVHPQRPAATGEMGNHEEQSDPGQPFSAAEDLLREGSLRANGGDRDAGDRHVSHSQAAPVDPLQAVGSEQVDTRADGHGGHEDAHSGPEQLNRSGQEGSAEANVGLGRGQAGEGIHSASESSQQPGEAEQDAAMGNPDFASATDDSGAVSDHVAEASSQRANSPRAQSRAWLYKRRFEPLATGHKRSVMQAAYTQVEFKKHGASNVLLDKIAQHDQQLLSEFQPDKGVTEVLIPKSLHMVKGILGTEEASKYEFGWCSECAWRFPPDPDRPDKSKEQLLTETCPRCGCDKYEACPGRSVKYKRRGWDFTVNNVIKWFHEDAEFRAAVEAAHPLKSDDPDGIAGHLYVHLLNSDCKNCLFGRNRAFDAGIWGIGADAGNIFKIRVGSTTIVGIRRYDMCVTKNAKCLSWQPLIVLAGPTEPSHLEHILKPTVDFFVKHDPGRPGAQPFKFTIKPNGTPLEIHHWPVLAFVEGDLMMMYKLMLSLSHSAYNACPRCALVGKHHGGAVRFMCDEKAAHRMPANSQGRVQDIHQQDEIASMLGVPAGYAGHHTPISRDHLPEDVQNLVRDAAPVTDDDAGWEDTEELMYTAYEMHARASKVQAWWNEKLNSVQPPLADQPPGDRKAAWQNLMSEADQKFSDEGVKGMPGFSRLSYFRYEHFFHFALAHLLLYGLVKDFWAVWTRPPEGHNKKRGAKRTRKHRLAGNKFVLPRHIRKEIARRAAQMGWTAQMKKRSADVLGSRSTWTMEEFMTFVETCSPFLLHDLPWKPEDAAVREMFERQWRNLRRAVLFCLRQEVQHHTPERLQKARDCFDRYAFAAQEAFDGLALMTAKLHHAVFHVVNQLACQGPGALYTEYWIERMIWYLKLYLKDRVKDNGEVIFVNDHLLLISAACCRCEHPDHCLTLEERKANHRPMLFPEYDEEEDGVLLLGSAVGAGVAHSQRAFIIEQLGKLLREHEESRTWYALRGWPAVPDDVLFGMLDLKRFIFDKYLQASLPCMDVVTCDEDSSHVASDNRWMFVAYTFSSGQVCTCVAQVQYFVRIRTTNGASWAFDPSGCVPVGQEAHFSIRTNRDKAVKAKPLRMAVCKLWVADVLDCEAIGSPDRDSGSVPDLLRVHNIGESMEDKLPYSARERRGRKCFYGEVLVNLPEVTSQLVPSIRFRGEKGRVFQYFMSSSKMSGKL